MADFLSGGDRGNSRGSAVGFKTLVLALTAIGLMYADYRSSSLKPARAEAASVLYPLQRLIALPYQLGAIGEHFRSRESLLAENRELREAQLEAGARLSRLRALEAETNRMRELLAASEGLGQKVRIAEVLSVAQDPYRQQIIVNRGSEDGVYRGQAVVDGYGVLGQIIDVNPKSSVALLITDANHGIPVEINRTGLQTIALGRGDGQSLSLPFLPGSADLKVGDLIVSSALGGRFPAGFPVAEVSEIHHQPGEHFAEAIALPAAHLNQGRQVLLVWGERPDTPLEMLPKPAPAKPAAPAGPRKSRQ